MKIGKETIQAIEEQLKNGNTIELHVEKGNIVLVALKRKVACKHPVYDEK